MVEGENDLIPAFFVTTITSLIHVKTHTNICNACARAHTHTNTIV